MFVFTFITRKLQTAKSPVANGLKLRTDITEVAVAVTLGQMANYERLNGVDRDNGVSETMTNGPRWITQQRCKLSQLADMNSFCGAVKSVVPGVVMGLGIIPADLFHERLFCFVL